MTPDFLFHPIFDKTKAPTGITDSKVPHPASQDRVNQRHDPIDRLGLVPPKNFLQLPQKGCPLLEQRWIPRPPSASSAAHPPERKTQEAKLLSPGQIDHPAFFLIDGNLKGCQFLPEACLDSLEEPIMLRLGVHQDHEI
jgi:hypothetical protein